MPLCKFSFSFNLGSACNNYFCGTGRGALIPSFCILKFILHLGGNLRKKLSLLPHSLMQSFIYISTGLWVFICFNEIKSSYYVILICCSTVSASGSLAGLVPARVHTHRVSSVSLCLCLRLHLCLTLWKENNLCGIRSKASPWGTQRRTGQAIAYYIIWV